MAAGLCGSVSLFGTLTTQQPTTTAEPLHYVLSQASQQPQFTLLTPKGLSSKNLYTLLLKNVPVTAGFLPSPG